MCKLVNRAEIADNDYSLSPGRYVGVVDQIDHDFDYETEMGNIKEELKELNADANVLADQIQTNLNELGL
jgi:type I restriction enzyme M protein